MTPVFTITNAVTSALTRIERARGFLQAARLSDDWLSGMQQRALVLEAHYSTHIEGTHLTLDQSEKLLAGEAPPKKELVISRSKSAGAIIPSCVSTSTRLMPKISAICGGCTRM